MTNWIPVSERHPTAEDADDTGMVAARLWDGVTTTEAWQIVAVPKSAYVAFCPLPRYTPPKAGPTDTECANILHYSALVCMNHLSPKDDVPREEQFAMVRRWFADVTARIERESVHFFSVAGVQSSRTKTGK